MPRIEDDSELETAIRFQAADQIAMPLENAVLDWQVLDTDASTSASGQMQVVVVAARRETVGGFVDAIRTAGLKPVGIDVSAFAMIRALAPELPAIGPADPEVSYEERMAAAGGEGETAIPMPPARLFCALGDVTNLAVARGSTCLFTRISPFGIEGIAQRLVGAPRADPRARPAVAPSRRPRRSARGDRRRPRDHLRRSRGARGGRPQARRRAPPLARLLRRPGGGRRGRGDRLLRARAAPSPACPRPRRASSGTRCGSAVRRRSRTSTTPTPPA